jgi:hypothetical protein
MSLCTQLNKREEGPALHDEGSNQKLVYHIAYTPNLHKEEQDQQTMILYRIYYLTNPIYDVILEWSIVKAYRILLQFCDNQCLSLIF